MTLDTLVVLQRCHEQAANVPGLHEARADLEHLFTDPTAQGPRQQAQATACAASRRGAHDTLFPDPLPLAGA